MDRPERVNARFRQLPAVDRLVDAAAAGSELSRWSLLAGARAVLAEARAAIQEGAVVPGPDLERLAEQVRSLAGRLEQPFPRRVLNATGVVLHTNLGRAPLPAELIEVLEGAAAGYSNLELDLETGERGSRLAHVSELLRILSGAEAALVVNNNAGAVFLAMDALAADREVVLSRGELVEIGGSFRVPDILAASRASLVEIGTTNRTHAEDYRRAIGPRTALLLKVHRSNFEQRGFIAETSLAELAVIARERGIALVEDRGSGSFVDLRPYGIPEAEAHSGLRDGADLVTFSGDKLLGGPQAGIILGRRELVEKMRRSPLARALRVDKLTLAALHWTLRTILEGRAEERLPVLRMLLMSADELHERAQRLAKGISELGLGKVSVQRLGSLVGGGALPDVELPGACVALEPEGSAAELSRRLRAGEPPVLARIQRGALLFDPRTLADTELEGVLRALSACVI